MDRCKAEQGRGREKRKNGRRERVRRKKTQMREKGGKSRNTVFFQWFVAPEGRKSRLTKAAGAERAGQTRDEKLHAVVARSTFPSENVQNTPLFDHFWQLRCWKNARHCGAKHISKSKCTKHTSFGPLLEVEMSKKCTPLWREAHFEVKMYKTPQCRTTFGSWDVEKVHAVVARSTFRSQNVQNTPVSDHFWKLRCRKSARRCGAKHISKSKCTKHLSVGRLLEVEMSKKCTPLWREAHFEVKMCKTPQCRTTFGSWDVEKVDAVVARSTFWSQHVKNTTVQTTFGGSDVASRGRCKGLCTLSKVSKTWGFCSIFNYNHHYITLQSNTLDYTTTTTSTTTPSLHSTTLHSTTLHCTQLHSIPLHFTTLHYTTLHNTTTTTTQLHSTTLHYTKLHYTTLHYTTLQSTTLHYTTLHCTTLHYLPLHFTTLHYTPLHYNYNRNYTPLHSTALNYTTLHYTTLQYTPLHYTTLHYTTLPSTTLHYITLHYTQLHYNYNYTPLH